MFAIATARPALLLALSQLPPESLHNYITTAPMITPCFVCLDFRSFACRDDHAIADCPAAAPGAAKGSSPPSSPEKGKGAAAQERSGQEEKEEKEEVEAVFGGLRRGVDPSREEAEWSTYAKAWKKGKPDVPRSEAIDWAENYGVSTSGSTAAILDRVGRAAEKDRFEGMQELMFGW